MSFTPVSLDNNKQRYSINHHSIQVNSSSKPVQPNARIPNIVKQFQQRLQENESNARNPKKAVTYDDLDNIARQEGVKKTKPKFESSIEVDEVKSRRVRKQPLKEACPARVEQQPLLLPIQHEDNELDLPLEVIVDTVAREVKFEANPVIAPLPPLLLPPLILAPPVIIEPIESKHKSKSRILRREVNSAAVKKVPNSRELALGVLENFEKITRERDAKGKPKRRGDYYLGLNDKKELIWKEYDPTRLARKKYKAEKKAVEKDLKKALEHVFEILQRAIANSITDINDGDNQGSLLSLTSLMDRILSRDLCQALLQHKSESGLRQSFINLVYQIQFKAVVETTRSNRLFLIEKNNEISTLVKLLSNLQIKALSQAVPAMMDAGKDLVSPRTSNSKKLRLERQLAKSTPRIQEAFRIQHKQLDEAYTENKTAFEVVSLLKKKEKEKLEKKQKQKVEADELLKQKERSQTTSSEESPRDDQLTLNSSGELKINPTTLDESINHEEQLVNQLGLGGVYNDCDADAQPALVARVISHPEIILGLFNDRVGITEVNESIKTYAESLDVYLNFHQEWLTSDRNLRHFIDQKLSGQKKDKAMKWYKDGNFESCVTTVFQQGTLHLTFKQILKFLFKNSLVKLSERVSETELTRLRLAFEEAIPRDDAQAMDIDKISALLSSVLKEFGKVNLA